MMQPVPLDGKVSMKKLLFAIVLSLFVSPPLCSAGNALEEVKALGIVTNLFPPQVELIDARDLGNLFEVIVMDPSRGKQIFYITKDGAYLLAGGNLIDKDKVNVTQVRYGEITKVDLSKFPFDDAIEIKRGDGAKKLIMFSDVECPFCRKAYDWLKTQTNYTLYMFLFPLDIHPKAAGKSVEVLCAKDREAAIDNAQADKDIGSEKCEAGEKLLAKQKAVATEIGVKGTPLFITDTGTRINGLDKQALENYLKN
jgi:thiol:disulfide interchange protein DsbC